MRIIYLGPFEGTCLDRANAYRRLGHEVFHLDLRDFLPKSRWIDRIIWRLGGEWLNLLVTYKLRHALDEGKFDICHIDGGELVSRSVIRLLRLHALSIVNYNADDPFSFRDGRRFSLYRKNIAMYDLVVVVRNENVAEAKAVGAKNVLYLVRAADEIMHRNLGAPHYFEYDVLFVGTWMEARDKFILEMRRAGVPVAIYGARWQRSPHWHELKDLWRGGHLKGEDYARAIRSARINLAMLSSGNRDLHTTRSAEIPAIGGLLCAPRTLDHLAMYQDGVEAIFWDSAAECASRCSDLLGDPNRAAFVRKAGHARWTADNNKNEILLRSILQVASGIGEPVK